MQITKSCNTCGNVEFEILPYVGEYKAKCIHCGSIVDTVKLEKYEGIIPRCTKCGSEIFKAKITKENDREYWELRCSSCDNEPKYRYCDEKGNEIDKRTRELLIIKGYLKELNEKVDSLQSNLKEIDDKVKELNDTAYEHDYEIREIKSCIMSCESEISDLREEVN